VVSAVYGLLHGAPGVGCGCVGQLRSTTRRCTSDAVRLSDKQRVGELQPRVERFSELEGTHVCECIILDVGFYSSAKCVHYRDKSDICPIGLLIRNKLQETWHYSVPQMRTNVKAACS